jgi:hypothetical protein
VLKISFRRRQGFELTNTAQRNENRSHWYRLIGMRRWALILMVADDNFTSESEPSRPTPQDPKETPNHG